MKHNVYTTRSAKVLYVYLMKGDGINIKKDKVVPDR